MERPLVSTACSSGSCYASTVAGIVPADPDVLFKVFSDPARAGKGVFTDVKVREMQGKGAAGGGGRASAGGGPASAGPALQIVTLLHQPALFQEAPCRLPVLAGVQGAGAL